jgi:hypothetical protein
MRLSYPELKLAYHKDTGKDPSEDGLFVYARIGTHNGNIIVDQYSCPESCINYVATHGGFFIIDIDYVEWLERLIIENKLIR